MSGAYFENFVISEIYKSYHNEGKNPTLYYYRDKDKNEIDLILEKDATLYPVEIKKAAIATKNMVSSFSSLKPTPPYSVGQGAIICNTQTLSAIDKNTLIVPVSKI